MIAVDPVIQALRIYGFSLIDGAIELQRGGIPWHKLKPFRRSMTMLSRRSSASVHDYVLQIGNQFPGPRGYDLLRTPRCDHGSAFI
jgi:hypothetical protein